MQRHLAALTLAVQHLCSCVCVNVLEVLRLALVVSGGASGQNNATMPENV